MEYKNPLVKDRWALRVVAHSNRAECYLRMKKWKVAQQDAERALEVGFSLFFCDFQEENAEIAPFFVHFNKR